MFIILLKQRRAALVLLLIFHVPVLTFFYDNHHIDTFAKRFVPVHISKACNNYPRGTCLKWGVNGHNSPSIALEFESCLTRLEKYAFLG